MTMSKNLIKKYYESFNQKDWKTFFELLHPQIIHEINQGHVEISKESFKKFIDRMNHSYEEQIKDINIYEGEKANTFASEYMVHGKYLRTDEGLPEAKGQTYILKGGAFFETENGLIKLVRNYYNLNEWIKMVNS